MVAKLGTLLFSLECHGRPFVADEVPSLSVVQPSALRRPKVQHAL